MPRTTFLIALVMVFAFPGRAVAVLVEIAVDEIGASIAQIRP